MDEGEWEAVVTAADLGVPSVKGYRMFVVGSTAAHGSSPQPVRGFSI